LRLVATDLDGTIVRSDGTVSARSRAALRRVRAAGAEIVVVTARRPAWLVEVVEELELTGYAVCCNGAVVYDVDAGEVVSNQPLAPETAERIIVALREAAPGVAFAGERSRLAIREPAYVPFWKSPDEHPRTDALEFVRDPVSKLVVMHPELSQVELYALVAQACGADATATISGLELVEISAAGITKAFALATLCEELAIEPAEVVAFGDMPNDLPVLEWAGLGVAVANAHPDVLAAADEVTASNDEDGVAIVLERLFPAG
jgi:Cof subfamily protein (haloacid dehalogenase superfamily)